MDNETINARVTYVVDEAQVTYERDFDTVREAEDWMFETMKAVYRRGGDELVADWENGGVGATLRTARHLA